VFNVSTYDLEGQAAHHTRKSIARQKHQEICFLIDIGAYFREIAVLKIDRAGFPVPHFHCDALQLKLAFLAGLRGRLL
jgi:hypothetical protein